MSDPMQCPDRCGGPKVCPACNPDTRFNVDVVPEEYRKYSHDYESYVDRRRSTPIVSQEGTKR